MDWYTYIEWGKWPAHVAAVLVFVGGWIYSAATYGFLLGFGLGWFPSALAAVLTWVAMRFLWGPILAIAGFLIVYSQR